MLTQPEPWMRGPIEGLEPLVAPVFYTFTQVREELAHYTEGLTTEQVWRRADSLPSLGFHLAHIAGSVDRLMTYLMEGEISPEQIAYLKSEGEPGPSLDELLAGVDAAFAKAESQLRTIKAQDIHVPRYIGRKRLPTSVLGLLVHISEHTQRHLGQSITTAKLAR
jgi:uncharacterized damage-inducible protein DinB